MEKLPTKYYSNIQESAIAKYLDWKVVSGSGSRACYPGDIESISYLGECKTHTKPSQNIKFILTVWDKICKEARLKFKFPVLFVDDGSQKLDKTWCMFNHAAQLDYMDGTVKVLDYPFTVKTNVVFNGDKLHKILSQGVEEANKPCVFNIKIDGRLNAYICPLETFKQLIAR